MNLYTYGKETKAFYASEELAEALNNFLAIHGHSSNRFVLASHSFQVGEIPFISKRVLCLHLNCLLEDELGLNWLCKIEGVDEILKCIKNLEVNK